MERSLFLIFITGCLSISLFAQPGMYSEEQIQNQDLFIQAQKEVLLNHPNKAEELYKKILKKDAKNDVVAFQLAKLYADKDDAINVKTYIDKAIKNNPANKWYYLFKSEFLEKENDFKGARDQYLKITSLAKNDANYLLKLGTLSEKALDFSGAINAYTKLEKLQGISETSSRRKFQLYASNNETDKAISELNALISKFPNNTRFRNNLASYYLEIGKKKEASKVYKKVLSIDPNDPTATIALSGDLRAKGNESNYFKALTNIIRNKEVLIDQKIIELVPYVEDLDNSDAETTSAMQDLLEELIATHPEEAKAYAIAGDAYLNSGNYQEAIRKYKSTLERTKKVFPVWEQLMFALKSEKDFEELKKVSMQALDYYPNQPIAYIYHADALSNLSPARFTKEERFLRGIESEPSSKYFSEPDQYYIEATMMAGKNKNLKYQIYIAAADNALIHKKFDKAENYISKALKINSKQHPELIRIQNELDSRNN